MFSFIFGKFLGVELLVNMVKVFLTLWETHQLCQIGTFLPEILIYDYIRLPVPPYFDQHLVLPVFIKFLVILVYAVVFIGVSW